MLKSISSTGRPSASLVTTVPQPQFQAQDTIVVATDIVVARANRAVVLVAMVGEQVMALTTVGEQVSAALRNFNTLKALPIIVADVLAIMHCESAEPGTISKEAVIKRRAGHNLRVRKLMF